MVAFKLMRAGIMGVVGAGSRWLAPLPRWRPPYRLHLTSAYSSNSIQSCGTYGAGSDPLFIFAIRGAITGLKGAFAGLTRSLQQTL